jgi:hypothetical protein
MGYKLIKVCNNTAKVYVLTQEGDLGCMGCYVFYKHPATTGFLTFSPNHNHRLKANTFHYSSGVYCRPFHALMRKKRIRWQLPLELK